MDMSQITLAAAETLAEQLENKEILNTAGKEALLAALRKDEATEEIPGIKEPCTIPVLSKEYILWFCQEAFWDSQMYRLFYPAGVEEKIVVEDDLFEQGWTAYPPMDGERGNHDYIHPTRSTLGRTRTRTLEDLKELELISEMVYEEAKKDMLSGVIQDEVGLLAFLFERSCYYK